MTLRDPVVRLCLFVLFLMLLVPVSITSAQISSPSPRIVQAINEKQLTTLQGNVHPLARAEFDQGLVPDSQPMNRILLVLQRGPEQEASLRQFLDDQESKSSPSFHQWLTPEQFGAQFGIADADLAAVTQWLTSQGFTDIHVGPGRGVIEFSGNAAQVRSAFHTEIHRFHVGTQDHLANSADPQIPAALAPVVAGIVSLHNFPRKSHARILGQFSRQLGKQGLNPLFTFPDPFNGSTFYGLGPGDFATIYNSKPLIAAGNDGTGQTIAIVGETNIRLSDVQNFRSMFGLPANFDSSNIILNGEDPGITSTDEEGEADLDVEWSGATAPGATVKFVVSASTSASAGIDLSALYIIEHNLAAVMSESYGECEAGLGSAGNAFYNSLWEQAAAQGITAILSSGDGGSAGCDDFNSQQTATHGLAVSGLASTPFNVSVGGTDFDQVNRWTTFWNSTNDATGSSAKTYIPEIPWNQNCAQIGLTGCGASAPNGSLNIVGGSGGQSAVYPKPAWQMGVTGVPTASHRYQPDISLFASPGFDGTGYVYCQRDETIAQGGGGVPCDITNASSGVLNFGIIGGTSASAPAFAGVMALVNQKQSTPANPAPRQGNANYVLYALAKKSGASCTSSTTELSTCIFNDVTKGNSVLPTGLPGVGTNSVPCKGGSPNCSISIASANGVLVDPAHTSTEAWTVSAGYDLVTGLGSVNIANLATNWSSASTIPTTTTLSLSPVNGITHGAENVSVSVTVKANTGTGVPTGDVSLIATLFGGATQGLDQFTLSNGAIANAKTQSLPGGVYNVTAHYAGDGTNAPSDSSPVQVTVGKETSQTFIVVPSFDSNSNQTNGNAGSVVYGSNYIIRMYVTDKNAVASPSGPPAPTCDTVNLLTCPTGTASLTANGAPLDGNSGTFNLNNAAYTRDLAPMLTGGAYSLVANYSGDSSFQPSNSAPHSLTVLPSPTTLNVYNTPVNTLVGFSLPISATADTNLLNGAAPAGTITFLDNGTPFTAPVTYTSVAGNSTQEARIIGLTNIAFTTPGMHVLTAKYSGDASYAASVSSATNISAFYQTTMTVTPSSTSINYGSSVTLTAKVVGSSLTPAMSGQILFNTGQASQQGTPPVLTNDGNGNQVLTSSITVTPTGSFSPGAQFFQDPNFETNSAVTSVNVIIPDFTLGNPPPAIVTAGQPQTVIVTITPASNMPSTVTLTAGPAPSGMAIMLSPATVNLNGAPNSFTATITSTAPMGGPVPNVVRKHASLFTLPRGFDSWSGPFANLAALFCLCFLFRRRKFGFVLLASLAFVMMFVPGCGGGGSSPGGGGGAPPPPQSQSTIALTTSSAKTPQGSSFILSVAVTGNSPTGTVNIFQGTPNTGGSGVAPPITLVNGTASVTVPATYQPGIYPFFAQYSGDSHNLGSQTNVAVQEVITGSTQINYTGQTGTLAHGGSIQIVLQ